MDDPILRELARFTLRYGRWISAAIAGAVVASVAVALREPPRVTMRAVFTTATTATEGPVESFEVAIRRATTAVAEAVEAGALPPDTQLTARGLMGEPPNLETTHLLELSALGSDPGALRRAIELAGDALERAQAPVAETDRARIQHHVAVLTAELARVEALPPTKEGHTLYLQAVKELVDSARLASPVRAYEAGFLAVYEPRVEARTGRLALPLAVGLAGGIVAGYVLAFCLAALAFLGRGRPAGAS